MNAAVMSARRTAQARWTAPVLISAQAGVGARRYRVIWQQTDGGGTWAELLGRSEAIARAQAAQWEANRSGAQPGRVYVVVPEGAADVVWHGELVPCPTPQQVAA